MNMKIKCCDLAKSCMEHPIWKKKVTISGTVPLAVLIIIAGLIVGLICLDD